INLSQLSVIATAKVSHFEILCHVHGFVPTVEVFGTPVYLSVRDDTIKNLDENCYRPSGLMMMRVGVLLLASFGANRKRELLRNGDAAEANQTEQGEHVVDFRGIKWWAKMREDHSTSSIGANTGGKSIAALQSILESSTLPVEVGVTTTTTVPFVTSSVTPPDSISRTGLQTRHPAERFVISSDSSHDLNANATDDEVAYVIRSSMPPPPILTVAIATTIIAGATSAPVHESGAGQVRPSIFRDFASPNMAEADTSAEVCFSAEIRMRLEHELRGRKKFKGKYAMQANWLKEGDVEIASLKAQLSLKEVEAAEAIHLRGQIANVEAAEAARVNELKDLKEINAVLEGQVTDLESAAASKDAELTSSNSQVAKMTQDLSSLQLSCDELSVKASTLKFEKDRLVDQLFKEQVEVVQNEQVKALSDRVTDRPAERRWIFSRGLKLAIMKCLQSPEYLTALGGVISRAMPRIFPLLAQLESRKDASMADIMDLLRLEGHVIETPEASQLQPPPEQLMVPIRRLEAQVVIGETSLLTGEASTSGVPTMATTTALSTTFIQASTVPPAPSTEVPPSPKIVFEQEELDTTPEHTSAS
ncbi:hypothetical protein Tco_0252374, partial [Tanacetum coccineum]